MTGRLTFEELLLLDPEELRLALHSECRLPDDLTPYQRGLLNGLAAAEQVLDLRHHSEMLQVNGGWMPDIRPATVRQRRGWLRGYANGILMVTDDPEAKDLNPEI